MSNFVELGISSQLVAGLNQAGIQDPTPIQAQLIPPALAGKDTIGEALTGSGKTLAYLLPLMSKIDSTRRETQAIILAPTHELAAQVKSEVDKLATNSQIPLLCQLLIGEASIKRQQELLRDKPQVVVGSPGRIAQLIQIKKLKAHGVKLIVLDEVDRLLEQTTVADCRGIIKATLRERQLLALTATLRPDTLTALGELMQEPQVIRLNQGGINPNIEHGYLRVDARDKIETLRRLSAAVRPQKILVFVNRNLQTEEIVARLRHHQVAVCTLSGVTDRTQRKKAVDGFRHGKYQVMLASDAAARGLDIADLHWVVNFNLPKDAREYLHRTGRVARHQGQGKAITLITGIEDSFMDKAAKELDITFVEMQLKEGRLTQR